MQELSRCLSQHRGTTVEPLTPAGLHNHFPSLRPTSKLVQFTLVTKQCPDAITPTDDDSQHSQSIVLVMHVCKGNITMLQV